MNKMGDAQLFIVEDIIVYTSAILITFTWDFWQNLFHAVGLIAVETPYHFGIYQGMVLTLAGVQLARKLVHWRYYR